MFQRTATPSGAMTLYIIWKYLPIDITPWKTWTFRTKTVCSIFSQVSEINNLTLSSEPMTTFPHGHYNSMKGPTLRTKTIGKNWISMTLHQRNNWLQCMLIKKKRTMPSTNLKTAIHPKIKSDSEYKKHTIISWCDKDYTSQISHHSSTSTWTQQTHQMRQPTMTRNKTP